MRQADWQTEDGSIRLYHGDWLHIAEHVGEVDIVMTDPPYSSGGQFRNDRNMSVHAKYVQTGSESHDRLLGFSGDSRDQFGYWYTVAMWTSLARMVSKPGAIIALFTDWRQLVATCGAIQTGGVIFRGIVPWFKRNARPTQGRWCNACEYVVWGTNGPRELEGNAFPGFYDVPFVGGNERKHITQKPVKLLEQLLDVAPAGGTVLDFCMGSGTTALACITRQLRFVGVELDRPHFDTCVSRITDELNRLALFEAPPKIVQRNFLGESQ